MYLNPLDKKWYPGLIISRCNEKRSYMIKAKNGAVYRKTQQHLKVYKPHKQCELTTKKKEEHVPIAVRKATRQIKRPARYQ